MRSNWKPFGVAAAVGVMLGLLAWVPADAQPKPSSAQITRATGRVEALKRGQTQWGNVGVGARLVEGDQVRAYAGASADLSLPDGSVVTVAENSRFVVTKLDYDAQTRERLMTFHLVIGKIKAQVTRAAVQVAKARQSNFLISTPSGVAAVRGTIVVMGHDAQGRTVMLVFPSAGQPANTAIATIVPVNAQGQPQAPVVVTGGQLTTLTTGPAGQLTVTPPTTVAANVAAIAVSVSNPAAAGGAFTAQLSIPPGITVVTATEITAPTPTPQVITVTTGQTTTTATITVGTGR